jgi:hypothetical protein
VRPGFLCKAYPGIYKAKARNFKLALASRTNRRTKMAFSDKKIRLKNRPPERIHSK